MSDAVDQDSKTEPATEKKKRDSIEKGRTPSSREALHFASLLGILLAASLTLQGAGARLSTALRNMMELSGELSFGTGADAIIFFQAVGFELARFLLPLVLLFALAPVAAAMLQNSPRIVGERIRPKLSKLSPREGAKRLFGRQGQTDFAKSVFKLAAIALVVGLLLGSDYRRMTNAMFSDPSAIPELVRVISVRLLAGVCIATLVLVAVDLVWSRMHWERELRMTRQEVKDEHKQSEGDPILKVRRLSLARERSRRRMIASVPGATLIIANPTHYAVALRYERGEDSAPLVLAKGRDLIALKIRSVAEEHGVPVIEDKALARSLHDAVEVEQMIPPEFYRAIAELLHYLQSRNAPAPNR